MHEEFRAEIRQPIEFARIDFELGKFLPVIGNDPIIFIAPATAQIEHEPFLADDRRQRAHAVEVELAVTEHPGSDNDMRRAGLEPGACVVAVDAAADV